MSPETYQYLIVSGVMGLPILGWIIKVEKRLTQVQTKITLILHLLEVEDIKKNNGS